MDCRIFVSKDSGAIYIFGTDKKYRPVIYINPKVVVGVKDDAELEKMKEALNFLISIVVEKMFVKSKVETWNIVINTEKQSVFVLPLKFISKMIQATSTTHANRLEKLYILNPTNALYRSFRFVEVFIETDTREKIKFLKAGEFQEMHDNIDLLQLEEKFGGHAPNLTVFWPPINTHSDEYLQKAKANSCRIQGIQIPEPPKEVNKKDKKSNKKKKNSKSESPIILSPVAIKDPSPIQIKESDTKTQPTISSSEVQIEQSKLQSIKDMTKKTGVIVKDFMTFKWVGKKGMCYAREGKELKMQDLEPYIEEIPQTQKEEFKNNGIELDNEQRRKKCMIY